MNTCDVLVVGGGPAGSSCAQRLVRAGAAVVVLDRASFPRDKVCAGWITPGVVAALDLDLDDYARANTLQPFTGFRVSTFDGRPRLAGFGRPISYGIRRCEFDHYLLRRSGAGLRLDEPLRDLRRQGADWIANDTVRARVVVGAGGHFCPVARRINPRTQEQVVAAQEVEFRLERRAAERATPGDTPELFFWPDLMGYGWTVRKGDYLNVGVGRLTQSEFPAAVAQFKEMLRARGLWPSQDPGPWKGHAYLLDCTSTRQLTGDGVVLVGDSAGLALSPSGEGILAAVESGLLAANAIAAAGPDYAADRLQPYAAGISQRFGPRGDSSRLSPVPAWLRTLGARALFSSTWLTRRFLIEDWFLHTRRTALAPGTSVTPATSNA